MFACLLHNTHGLHVHHSLDVRFLMKCLDTYTHDLKSQPSQQFSVKKHQQSNMAVYTKGIHIKVVKWKLKLINGMM